MIAPDYPAGDTNAELADGLAAILDRERIRQVHVLGGSAGGLAAQSFVRHCPDRTASLILSHVPLLERESGKRLAKTLGWLRLMPQPILRAFFKRSMRGLQPQADTPEIALFKAHFLEIANYKMTKAQIISLMKRTVELTETTFTPHDLEDWPGRILLLMSEDDPATPEPARQAMMAMYPQAEAHLFSGGGHAASILKQDEYLDAIEQFIQNNRPKS
ncbi:MAG: alpha/beta hydrolase [Anaerolineae bacterium]|nr:alpha/beta hydrolase [Anaerolineae bacterium]